MLMRSSVAIEEEHGRLRLSAQIALHGATQSSSVFDLTGTFGRHKWVRHSAHRQSVQLIGAVVGRLMTQLDVAVAALAVIAVAEDARVAIAAAATAAQIVLLLLLLLLLLLQERISPSHEAGANGIATVTTGRTE